MNNTVIEQGKPGKGRVFACGNMAHATIVIGETDWDIPNCNIPKNPSWQELNRGKQSKRQRRK